MSSGLVPEVSQARFPATGSRAGAGEHCALVYERDAELLERLASYVAAGLAGGGSTLVIATPEHLEALQQTLRASGVDLARAILEDRYMCLDAETTLARFMVGDWPDESLFREFLGRPLRRAGARGRHIHAFGEMVSLLWERGESAAALELERLWNVVLRERPMSLLCAYADHALGDDSAAALDLLCACHSAVSRREQ